MVDLIPPYRSPSLSTSRVLAALSLHLKFRSASLPPYRGPPPLHLKSWPAPLAAHRSPPLDLKCRGWPPFSTSSPGRPRSSPTSSSGRRRSLPIGHRPYRLPFHLKSTGLPPCLPVTLSSTASVLVGSIPATSSPGRSPSSPTARPISSLGRPPSLVSQSWCAVSLSSVLVGLPTYLPQALAGLPPYLVLVCGLASSRPGLRRLA
ncbi:hypothetical protein CF327_g4320 [Tilletia walkeri]|nr:hypothetical protein CF327_g4320 [Tilletia walkeri]